MLILKNKPIRIGIRGLGRGLDNRNEIQRALRGFLETLCLHNQTTSIHRKLFEDSDTGGNVENEFAEDFSAINNNAETDEEKEQRKVQEKARFLLDLYCE